MENNFDTIAANKFEKFKKYYLQVVLVFLVLASAGVAFYFYSRATVNPQQAANEEAQAVIAKVGKLILLPENEQPTVATVSDPQRLADQPFFSKAKKGDKVLIYTNARKAILYDPELNKIIEVAPVTIGTPAASQNQVQK